MKRYGYGRSLLCAAFLGITLGTAGAAVPTLDAFFEGAQIRSVSISPDGKSLAMIVVANGKEFVAVKDRTAPRRRRPSLPRTTRTDSTRSGAAGVTTSASSAVSGVVSGTSIAPRCLRSHAWWR